MQLQLLGAQTVDQQVNTVISQAQSDVNGFITHAQRQLETAVNQATKDISQHIGDQHYSVDVHGADITAQVNNVGTYNVQVPVHVPTQVEHVNIPNVSIDVNNYTDTYTISNNNAPLKTVTKHNNNLYKGENIIVQQGTAGKNLQITKKTANEHGSNTKIVHSQSILAGTPRIVEKGTKVKPAPKPAAPSIAHGTVWDSLAQCESGGNWSINTGNGYYGGLQFHPQTWLGHGGGQYAPTADQATREQQIEIAKRVQASQGWGAWPACTSKLGIR